MLPLPARELTEADWELVEFARRVIDANTDAPVGEDGVHTVGAAVRADDGRVYVGVNLYHFTGGPCAELVALGAARAGGARSLEAIVAVGNQGRGILAPCGRDRQILLDYHPAITVIVPTEHGPRSVSTQDLMLLAFDWTVNARPQRSVALGGEEN